MQAGVLRLSCPWTLADLISMPFSRLLRATLTGLLILAGPARSADGSFDATGSVLQMLLGLGLIVGLLVASLYFLRRIGLANRLGGAPMRIRGATTVGPRERVVLVEVADTVLVLGVAPGRITALHHFDAAALAETPPTEGAAPAPADFRHWLKASLERRPR